MFTTNLVQWYADCGDQEGPDSLQGFGPEPFARITDLVFQLVCTPFHLLALSGCFISEMATWGLTVPCPQVCSKQNRVTFKGAVL
jgi:hypothetical protein